MTDSLRDDRLKAERESLETVKQASSIFNFESTGDPPDRYSVFFRGKGVARNVSAHSDVEIIELHRCEIRLPYSYPQRGPDIRWLTPIFHPNVSFSGFINLQEIGLPWEKDITLDVVCERLWDVARSAFLNREKASNYAAKNWFEDNSTLRLPVDRRPLRDKLAPSSSNVIHYRRRGESSLKLPPTPDDADVLYIGEDTPLPPPPPRRKPSRQLGQDDGDDDILYIG